MTEEENEEIAICPVCLETLKIELYFTSGGYLYHKICFCKLNLKSLISRQNVYYYFPVNKVVNCKVYFEKVIKNKFTGYDRDGYDQDGFNRKGLKRNGFNINGIDENGYNRFKETACEEKVKQAIKENPWNIYYASEVFRKKYEIMKECVESDPYTYQYATLDLENKSIDLAIIFLGSGGSFSLLGKHLRNNKKIGMVAVKINPNNFQYLGKNLKNDDLIFELVFQQHK